MAAVGRQMAAKTTLEALLGGSWGGLGSFGASLGRLGDPGEGNQEAMLVLLSMFQRQKLNQRPYTCCDFKDV